MLVPGKPDSAGAQFFVAVVDQPALDGQYTVFGHVSDGMEVVQKISETPVDATGLATERVEIRHVRIRDTPPPAPVPFSTETPQELAAYRAVLDTSAGPITIEFLPDKAPTHVRQFLRLAAAGVFDGMAFHRVVPGFVIQTGALSSRAAPLTEKQQALVHNLAAGVQRHEARQRHRVDGARRRSGQRDDVVLHLHRRVRRRSTATTRRSAVSWTAWRLVDAIEAAPRNGESAADANRAEDRADRAGAVKGRALLLIVLLSLSGRVRAARAAVRSRSAVCVRERDRRSTTHLLELHLSRPCVLDPMHPLILFATGDGGWRGKDKDAFEHLTQWGYPLVGFSAPSYLTHITRHTHADDAGRRRARLRADHRASRRSGWACADETRTILLGVSRGSGLAVAAAGEPICSPPLVGVVAVALTREEEYVQRPKRHRNAPRAAGDGDARQLRIPAAAAQPAALDHPVDARRLSAGGRGAAAARSRFALHQLHPIASKNHSFTDARSRCTRRCRRRSSGSASSRVDTMTRGGRRR